MKPLKYLWWLVALVPIAAAMVCATPPSHAGTSLNVNLSIGDAPPPPVVVVREQPRVVVVPGTAVYVVEDRRFEDDYDFFRCGNYWFIYRSGYWYRARTHRGPFQVCEERIVPAAIFAVPQSRWKHHPHGMPPGQAKKMAMVRSSKGKGNKKH